MAKLSIGFASIIAVGVFLSSPDGQACTVMVQPCRGGLVAVAPADPPYIAFTSAFDGEGVTRMTSAPQITLTDSGGTNVDVTVAADPDVANRWVITPATKLASGAKYKVAWQQACEPREGFTADPTEKEIDAPQIAPLPTKLGTASVTFGPLKRAANTSSSSCDIVRYTGDEVTAQVALAFDASFAPWKDIIQVERWLDGVPLPEEKWHERRATDTYGNLRASCDSPDTTGITPAKHVISYRAKVPGRAELLTAETTVDFTCATAPTSVGASSSGSNVGNNGGGPVPENNDSGCAMATASTEASSTVAPAAALLLLAAVAFGRSRRRNRRLT